MSYKKIILEKKGAIARIILNRPEVMNAMDRELISELADALADVDKDDEIRVAILTGAGRAFSAGRDMNQLLEASHERGGLKYKMIEDLSKPVIAAVNGYCFTGALELVLCADIIIASEHAIFCDTHARYARIPGGGLTQRLPRLLGSKKAKELMFTSDRISAQEAERIGLVNKVVPPEKLEEAAIEMAGKIIKNSPRSIKAMKYLVNRGMSMSLEDGLQMEAQAWQDAHNEPLAPDDERKKRLAERLEKKEKA